MFYLCVVLNMFELNLFFVSYLLNVIMFLFMMWLLWIDFEFLVEWWFGLKIVVDLMRVIFYFYLGNLRKYKEDNFIFLGIF